MKLDTARFNITFLDGQSMIVVLWLCFVFKGFFIFLGQKRGITAFGKINYMEVIVTTHFIIYTSVEKMKLV